MRVLVTGGASFAGRAVARHLAAHGHVVSLDVVPEGGVDGVCHLAARTQVRESVADPVGYFAANLSGTVDLLAALSPRPVRFVLASTMAVYGLREGRLSEADPAAPTTPYGASKLAAEQLIGFQAATGRLAAVSLRCFNIAGAYDGAGDDDLSRIIPKALSVAAGGTEPLRLNGDGTAVRDYTHVADVAEAYRLALEGAVVGEHRVFNVGAGGAGTSLADVVEAVRRITGRPVPVGHLPPKPEAQAVLADTAKIRAQLGWQPSRSTLDEIVRDGWQALATRAARSL